MTYSTLGKNTIEISGSDFIRGMTSGNNLLDGGFSDQSYGINLESEPGVLSFNENVTEPSTSPIGIMIGCTPNDTTTADPDMFFLAVDADTQDGTYYWWNGTTLTLKRTDSTNNYIFGGSYIGTYRNEIYATSDQAITRWTADDSVFEDDFYDTSDGWDTLSPHPILAYDNDFYYGNGNELLRQTAVGVKPSDILTLTEGTDITALGIDPGSGKMLISTTQGPIFNLAGNVPSLNKVLYYDGFSNKPVKAIVVDEMITAFYSVGSTVFVTYGQNLGYWTGSGIQFLRQLDINLAYDELAYRDHITSIGSTLFVIEGRFILAFGDIVGGASKAYSYVYRSPVNKLSLICNLGENVLGIGTLDEAFLTLDLDTLGINASWYSNRYSFPRPITFNQIVIEYFTSMPTENNIGAVNVIQENDTLQTLQNVTNTVANKYVATLTWPTITSRVIQINYTPMQSTQIRRITIYYNDYA